MTGPTFRLTEARDPSDALTHVICCVCCDWTAVDDLWIDPEGQKWDMCRPCGEKEGAA